MRRILSTGALLLCLLAVAGCGDDEGPIVDADFVVVDTSTPAVDVFPVDTGAEPPDAGPPDAGPPDADIDASAKP